MDTTFHWFFWLFIAAFIIHNTEEALYLPKWSKAAGKFHKPVGPFEFRFALLVITAIAFVITLYFCFNGKQSFACSLYFSFNFGMFLNVFFPHLAGTIVMKRYTPGLLTGVFLILPATSFILIYGHNNGYYSFPEILYITIPFAILMTASIPLLFRIGKYIQNAFHVCENRI